VERGDLVQTLVASGRVESPRRVDIGSPITGTVRTLAVREGDRVRAGQLLVALDDSELRAAAGQARTALAQAEARLAQLRGTSRPVAAESVRQAQVNLANADRALERSRDLFSRGFVGQAALDEAQRARDVSASQLASAQLQLAAQAEGGTDERVAAASVDEARAAMNLAQARLDLSTIESPADGQVIARSIEAGSVVQPGKVMLVLSPAGATELVVQVDEKNLPYVRVGQSALASADAYPQQRFAAKVTRINPAVDATRGSIEVRLSVAETPAYLLQDMTVSVDIEIARRQDVLSVPTDALREGGAVLVVREGRAVRQPVTLGARGTGSVEVVSGLREGEWVVAGAQAAVEGRAVRPAGIRPGRPT
jgi:HlyD family secretion protein